MSREDEARAFHYAVYDTVQLIPYGKVTTYGHIAKLIYKPRNSRQVGQALKYLPAGLDNELGYPFSTQNVPWWRVISSSGVISPRTETAVDAQKQRLREEGVEVEETTNKIVLSQFGWFPETDFDEYS
jgi:methylated-DNA-protein-cysteine methyltransferase-like protein